MKHGLVKPGSGYKQYFIEFTDQFKLEFHWYTHGIGFNLLTWLYLTDYDEVTGKSFNVFKPGFQFNVNLILCGFEILYNYKSQKQDEY
jgi:hypothetical protein